ncbi:hypothetical protein FPZ24_01925 [Sphingomonas panacisoli]|uniref:DUF2927 domain-containing protein n=1 Tax=Sphingomonas panacisoli TaxID=1813879 RepID=A0A5B8LFE6_9SPHN|nr:hypothetical protein [Sphingomonas panacisoli]QDZ06382.1 hypothetical protein FPZ24_01925 [Sphingomonas panacisoli]
MRLIFSLLLIAVPSVAVAQDVKSQDDIVVRAKRKQDRAVAEAFVRSVSTRTDGQLARFHQPVCADVIGLPQSYATIVKERIIADAVSVGAPVAKKATCTPNLIVIVATSGSDLVIDMRSRRPDWLTGLSPSDIDALTTPAPARAWSVTSLRNEAGEELSDADMQHALFDKTRDTFSQTPVLRVRSTSIRQYASRRDLEASFVVIDQSATVGLSLRQIADYAAMRGLGHARPPASGGQVDTILSLLDGSGTAPRALTGSDTAFLRGLYASDGLSSAATERNAIARRIANEK